eukprot:1524799-Rhodomonas_salina.2
MHTAPLPLPLPGVSRGSTPPAPPPTARAHPRDLARAGTGWAHATVTAHRCTKGPGSSPQGVAGGRSGQGGQGQRQRVFALLLPSPLTPYPFGPCFLPAPPHRSAS